MVSRFGQHATFASSCKRTDVDGGLGIHRNAQGGFCCICLLVDLLQVAEDRVGFRKFFWGCVLATFFKEYPSSFSLVVIVSAVGNSSSLYPFCAINWRRTSVAVRRV